MIVAAHEQTLDGAVQTAQSYANRDGIPYQVTKARYMYVTGYDVSTVQDVASTVRRVVVVAPQNNC